MNKIQLLIIALFVVAIGILIIYVIIRVIPDWQTRSQFGDMFGAVDVLFSGLAFIGLIYTIYQQSEEMKKQLDMVEKSNRLNGLATLVDIYSQDEEKYKNENDEKSTHAREMKESILSVIEEEYKLEPSTKL